MASPPRDFDEHPILVPEQDRPRISARLTSGKYVAAPPPTAALTPKTPHVGARFTLRWTRKKTGHVDAGTGQWDVFQDRIELACKAKNPIFLPLFDTTIENPGKDDADVYVLSPTQILVHRVDV